MVYPRTFYTDLNSLFCKPPKVATLTPNLAKFSVTYMACYADLMILL